MPVYEAGKAPFELVAWEYLNQTIEENSALSDLNCKITLLKVERIFKSFPVSGSNSKLYPNHNPWWISSLTETRIDPDFSYFTHA